MRLIIKQDSSVVAKWASNYIVDKINDANPTAEKPFVLGLTTGSTPLATYKELINAYKAGEVSFENVVTFNMDEFVNLSTDHPESYYKFMWDNLFNHINIKSENANLLDGNADDLKVECDAFERKIKEYGGVNLFLSGVGVNGHLAYNAPGSSLSSRTREKFLSNNERISNAHYFDNDVEQVPKSALTVGVATIMDADEVMVLITGHSKALALQKGVEGSVNQMWVISALQQHQKTIIVCDEDATAELKVGTYRYFKEIN